MYNESLSLSDWFNSDLNISMAAFVNCLVSFVRSRRESLCFKEADVSNMLSLSLSMSTLVSCHSAEEFILSKCSCSVRYFSELSTSCCIS